MGTFAAKVGRVRCAWHDSFVLLNGLAHAVTRQPAGFLGRRVGLRCANPTYEDLSGFCKVASLEEIKSHGDVLTPGRYVCAAADDLPSIERFMALKERLDEQLAQGEELGALMLAKLEGVVVDG